MFAIVKTIKQCINFRSYTHSSKTLKFCFQLIFNLHLICALIGASLFKMHLIQIVTVIFYLFLLIQVLVLGNWPLRHRQCFTLLFLFLSEIDSRRYLTFHPRLSCHRLITHRAFPKALTKRFSTTSSLKHLCFCLRRTERH